MRSAGSLQVVVDGLAREGLLSSDASAEAEGLIARLRDTQPWYVRIMVGIGAWLASLLLIGFVAGIGLAVGGGTIVGLALMAAAVLVRRHGPLADNVLVVQGTMAASLAGQALFAWGIADSLGDDPDEWLCALMATANTAMFFAFPDRVHRVLMVVFAACALVSLVYIVDLAALVPLFGPLLAGALVLIHRRRPQLYARGWGAVIRPLEAGLVLSAFGCLLLSTVYVLPELDSDFTFYPRPWISTVLLGALLLYVGHLVQPMALAGAAPRALPVAAALSVAVVAAAWWAPGLLLALIVVLLGTVRGHATMAYAGIGFLAVFTTAFFYGIEVPLPTKAITLIATGLTVLLARWVLLRMLSEDAGA